MKALRLSLLSLLMLVMPFTGFAAATAPGCAMQQLAAQAIEPTSPAHDMQHLHHDGMDMSSMDADMHAEYADASSPQDAGCDCGCLCAGSCIAGGGAAMSLTLQGSPSPQNSTEAPALPQTVATRASITDDLLRPPTATA